MSIILAAKALAAEVAASKKRGALHTSHIPAIDKAVRELCGHVSDPAYFATPAEVDAARAEYGCDEIEIDDGALASRTDGEGRWVMAWVWVPDE